MTHVHKGRTSEQHVDKAQVLSCLNIQSGQHVLDAGCGDGYMSKEFARLLGGSGKVWSVDSDAEAAERLRRESSNGCIEAIAADITEAMHQIPDDSLDLVYMSMVFHGFTAKEREGFVREAQRMLSGSGRLAILEFLKKESPFGPPVDLRWSPDELVSLVGMKAVSCARIGEWLYLETFTKA